jgi:predicted SprT family Zn-dependent metalloprotease
MAMIDAKLSTELETLAVREIAAEWATLNWSHFGDRLTPPQIALSDAAQHLGRFFPETRTLELSRALVLEKPWGTVLEVLKHEVAHQYVHEALGVHDEPPHGPTFRKLCAQLGIDAAATSLPEQAHVCGEQHARILQRVARLLALAESPNQHEAEAAAAQAQRLMLKHNLEQTRSAAECHYGFRHVGRPTGRLTAADRLLAMILGKRFFVHVIWITVYRPLEGKRGRVLELCGTPENLEIAAYAHQFLEQTAARLWREHKRSAGLDSDADRRSYLAGVMSGFAAKLGGQERAQRAEGLVWISDPSLDGYFRRRFPRTRSMRSAHAASSDAFRQGQRAGQGIVLHRGLNEVPARRGLRLTSGAS